MALEYIRDNNWSECEEVSIPDLQPPDGFALYEVLTLNEGADHPGSMEIWKRVAGEGCGYLVLMKDVDGENQQIQVADFPGLLSFFNASFAYSFLHAFQAVSGDRVRLNGH